MFKISDLSKYEIKDLFEHLIELRPLEAEGFRDIVSWANGNGWDANQEAVYYPAYGYRLGLVNGKGLYDEDELLDLYVDAFKELGLDNIIETCDTIDDGLWVLTPQWGPRNLRINDDAITQLYYTQSETERLYILERAIEAIELENWNIVDRQAIKLSKEALKLEKEGVPCR